MIPDLDYAFYVWTSYGLFVLVVLWQYAQPRVQRRRITAQLNEELALRTGRYDDTNP